MKKIISLYLVLFIFQLSYSQDKKVGVGTYSPDANLHVKGDNNTQKILKAETPSGNEVLNIKNDGSIEIPANLPISSGAYEILTRNKITNKIEKISSQPAPESDPIWNVARVNTKTFKGNIPSGSDLNNYIETGIFNTETDAIAILGINYPEAKSGSLEVFNYDTSTYQIYHTKNNDIFIRTRQTNLWSAWIKASSQASGLERINEGAYADGWRLMGRNPDNYGSIGAGAIDFSLSFDGVNGGAKGEYSFVTGLNQSMVINPGTSLTTTFMAGDQNEISASPSSGVRASSLFGYQNKITGNGFGINVNGASNTVSSNGGASNANGYRNTVSGFAANANGQFNYARAVGETAIGIYGTDYTPTTSLQRIFNVGIGPDAANRADGLSVFKDGSIKIGVTPAIDNTITKLYGRKSDGTFGLVDKNNLLLTIGNTDEPDAGNGYSTNLNTSTVVAFRDHLTFEQGEGANNNVAVLQLSPSILNQINNSGSIQRFMNTNSLGASWENGNMSLGGETSSGVRNLLFASTGNGSDVSQGDQVNLIVKPGYGFELGAAKNTDNTAFIKNTGEEITLSVFNTSGGNVLKIAPDQIDMGKTITGIQSTDNNYFQFKQAGNPFASIYGSNNSDGILEIGLTDGYYKNKMEPGLLYIQDTNKSGKYYNDRLVYENISAGTKIQVTPNPSQSPNSTINVSFPAKSGTLVTDADMTITSINEGPGLGYRLSISNPLNHGNVGSGAFDISRQSVAGNKGATGEVSVATGEDTQASGWGAFAGGSNVINNSTLGFAYGGNLTLGGFGSSALGYGNIIHPSTGYAFTSGRNNTSKGIGSATLGLALQSTGAGSLVVGRANIEMPGQVGTSAPSVNDYLFVVGNGTINNSDLTANVRSNAFSVQANGKVTINTEPVTNNTLTKLYARNDDGTFGIVTRAAYKSYSVLISQTGALAPTTTILENSVGSVILTRVSAGTYKATLSGAFTIGKTTFQMTPTGDHRIFIKNDTNNSLTISVINNQTGLPEDGILANNPLDVKVYY